MANAFKFRIDHHGSLVRPSEILVATERHAAGELSSDELAAIEVAAIGELVRQQRNLSTSVVTDGFARRADRFDGVAQAVEGFELRSTHRGDRWIAVTGELRATAPIVSDLDAIRSVTETAIKVSLPAPSAMAGHFWDNDASKEGWESPRQLGDALAVVMRAEIERLFADGVQLVQLDNHRMAGLLSPCLASGQLSLADSIAVDTLALADLNKPETASIGICPAIELGAEVDVAAAAELFASVPVNRWVLPFHTGSEAESALLGAVPDDLDVCLGVVDAAAPELADLGEVLTWLDGAAEIRDGEDNIALSPNQGFADAANKPVIGADDQWRKIVQVETLARMFWGNEL